MDRTIAEKIPFDEYSPQEGDVWVSDITGKPPLRIHDIRFEEMPRSSGRVPYENSPTSGLLGGAGSFEQPGMVILMRSAVGWNFSFWACPSPSMFAETVQRSGYVLMYRNAPDPSEEDISNFFQNAEIYRVQHNN